jgi:hypothetical protein
MVVVRGDRRPSPRARNGGWLRTSVGSLRGEATARPHVDGRRLCEHEGVPAAVVGKTVYSADGNWPPCFVGNLCDAIQCSHEVLSVAANLARLAQKFKGWRFEEDTVFIASNRRIAVAEIIEKVREIDRVSDK